MSRVNGARLVLFVGREREYPERTKMPFSCGLYVTFEVDVRETVRLAGWDRLSSACSAQISPSKGHQNPDRLENFERRFWIRELDAEEKVSECVCFVSKTTPDFSCFKLCNS